MLSIKKTKEGVGNIELVETPIPDIGPRDVLMKVWGAGVCGSDLHIQKDKHFYKAPVTLGHEYSGVVADIGKEVTSVKVGDRIVSDIEVTGGWLGVTVDGGFAEYMRIPENVVYKLPDNVSLDAGIMAEPTVGIVHCLQERIEICAGDFVVIVGPGPMGLLSAQFAKLKGARAVAMVGMKGDEFRMEIAKKLGVDHICYMENNALEEIMELSRGGADFVANCAGRQESLQFAIDVAKPANEGSGGKGKIAMIAIFGQPVAINLDKVAMGQLDISGGWSCNGSETWERAIDLLGTGKFHPDETITHRYALEDWEQAFADVRARKTGKAVLMPNGLDWAK